MLARTESAVYGSRFRQKRLRRFLAMVDEIIAQKGNCRILDLGGKLAYWQALYPLWHDRSCHITLVNLVGEAVPEGQFTSISGDACDLDQFDNLTFDVVHSNSVIEHVGPWRDQCRMAREVRRLAHRYFVQTPNFWFPIEPHFRTPLIHWLPEPWRVAIVSHRAWVFIRVPGPMTRRGASLTTPDCSTPKRWRHYSRMPSSSTSGWPGSPSR